MAHALAPVDTDQAQKLDEGILIAHWPHDGWRFVMWRGIHVPLWPQRGLCAWYDREDFPWDDSSKALLYFHWGVQIVEVEEAGR